MPAASARPRRRRDRLLVAGAILCLVAFAVAAPAALVALLQGTVLVDELPAPDLGTATSPEHAALVRRAVVAGAVAALALAGAVVCILRRYAAPAARR